MVAQTRTTGKRLPILTIALAVVILAVIASAQWPLQASGTTQQAPVIGELSPYQQSITAQWSHSPEQESREYLVQWKTTGQQWSGTNQASVPGNARAHTITPLEDGTAYTVRIGAVDQEDATTWSSELTATPGTAAGAPAGMRLIPLHKRIQPRWNAPADGTAVDEYIVEWKTGEEDYDSARQLTTTELQENIRDLENGAVYAVRVSTVSAGATVASATLSTAPVPAREIIESQIVENYQEDFPWVQQAWENQPVRVAIRGKGPGAYVLGFGRPNGFRGVGRGISVRLADWAYRGHTTVLHELAHHFTLDNRAPDNEEAVAAGWMYFSQRLKGHCPVGEVYADVITFVTRGEVRRNMAYLMRCPEVGPKATPDAEAVAVAKSVMAGEIPEWFNQKYTDENGQKNLDAIWSDLKRSNYKRGAAYMMRTMYGGFCSFKEANWAIGSTGPRHGNPWKDGGCTWRQPQDLFLTTMETGLKLDWEPPLYQTTPDVTHYLIEWRDSGQQYDPSRQATVPADQDLTYAITGLEEDTQYTVRVSAVNDSDTSVLTDKDGHGRSAEAAATTGKPNAPAVTATGQQGQVSLSWTMPAGSDISLAGYLVEWRLADQDYEEDNSKTLTGASSTTTTVTGLSNNVEYALRVTAVTDEDERGTPSQELRVIPNGVPEQPTNVQAVGGRNSILVWWEPKPESGPPTGYLIEWRRGANYEPGNQVFVPGAATGSYLMEDRAGHTTHHIRVTAVNDSYESVPSEEYTVKTGVPGAPTDLTVQVKGPDGFALEWDRPDPYYPNNPDFRPVRDAGGDPILDADGNTVPQFRYDINIAVAGTNDWCYKGRYRNVSRGNSTLEPGAIWLNFTRFCPGVKPVEGESYQFRVRAAYVWLNSGATKVVNGPWVYSEPIEFNPAEDADSE